MAECYALIGEVDRALEWVDHAIHMGTTNVAFLGEHAPFLGALRGNCQFEALLDKARRLSESLTSDVRLPEWA